jgi:hypothetical protein
VRAAWGEGGGGETGGGRLKKAEAEAAVGVENAPLGLWVGERYLGVLFFLYLLPSFLFTLLIVHWYRPPAELYKCMSKELRAQKQANANQLLIQAAEKIARRGLVGSYRWSRCYVCMHAPRFHFLFCAFSILFWWLRIDLVTPPDLELLLFGHNLTRAFTSASCHLDSQKDLPKAGYFNCNSTARILVDNLIVHIAYPYR